MTLCGGFKNGFSKIGLGCGAGNFQGHAAHHIVKNAPHHLNEFGIELRHAASTLARYRSVQIIGLCFGAAAAITSFYRDLRPAPARQGCA